MSFIEDNENPVDKKSFDLSSEISDNECGRKPVEVLLFNQNFSVVPLLGVSAARRDSIRLRKMKIWRE